MDTKVSGPIIPTPFGDIHLPSIKLPGELGVQIAEFTERHTLWSKARQFCESKGKPLLRIGMRRSFLEPPNGDVTLDFDPAVANIPSGVVGDERDMPFGDKQFGVCFNEHTLEHLHTPADVQKAINECVRVADMAIIITPSPNSQYSNMFCPTHNLRLWLEDNVVKVAFNEYRTGFGFIIGPLEQIAKGPAVAGLPHLILYNEAPLVVEVIDKPDSSGLLPMAPKLGPPLPRGMGVYWPWS